MPSRWPGASSRSSRIGRWLASPRGLLESYPDEGWTFDHAVALAAVHIVDHLDGSDHRAASARALAALKQLADKGTGLVPSSFTRDGRVLDGPEGSTLW